MNQINEEQQKRIEEEERIRAEARNKAEKEIKKEKQAKEKKRKGIGCLVLIGLVIGIVAIVSIGGNGGDKKTQPTTETPAKSVAPLTPEEKQESAYIQSVGKINNDVKEAMAYFGDLFIAKPLSALWTEEEILNVAVSTLIIENSYEQAKEIEPPEKFTTAHSFFLSGLSKYAEAMPLLREGIDYGDDDKINQSANLLNEGVVFINQAIEELNKLK